MKAFMHLYNIAYRCIYKKKNVQKANVLVCLLSQKDGNNLFLRK